MPSFRAGHCVFDHPDGARGEAEATMERRILPLLRQHVAIARFAPVTTRTLFQHRPYGLRAITTTDEDVVMWHAENVARAMNLAFLRRCGIGRPDGSVTDDAKPFNSRIELPGVRRIERWMGVVEGGTQDVETGEIMAVRRIAMGYQLFLCRFEHIEIATATQAVRA